MWMYHKNWDYSFLVFLVRGDGMGVRRLGILHVGWNGCPEDGILHVGWDGCPEDGMGVRRMGWVSGGWDGCPEDGMGVRRMGYYT